VEEYRIILSNKVEKGGDKYLVHAGSHNSGKKNHPPSPKTLESEVFPTAGPKT